MLVVALGTYPYWCAALGRYLVRAEPPVAADIAVVLAGDFSGQRILKGGDLVRQGLAPKALVSGPAGMYGLYECDLAIPYAVGQGYPASYFERLPNNSKSTASEAEAVIAELRRRHVHRVDLVTSNYHTRRAGNIFRSKGPDLEFHVVAAPDRFFLPDRWWKEREGRKTFLIEWIKTVGTWLGM